MYVNWNELKIEFFYQQMYQQFNNCYGISTKGEWYIVHWVNFNVSNFTEFIKFFRLKLATKLKDYEI